MSDHVVTVPEIVWAWAQSKSGKTNPASFLREVLYTAVIVDAQDGRYVVGAAVGGNGSSRHSSLEG